MMRSLYCAAAVAACFNLSAMEKASTTFSEGAKPSETESRRAPLSELERINPLRTIKEQENYKSTWDETLTLEKNLTNLCQSFADNCCLIFCGSGDFVLRQPDCQEIRYNGMSKDKMDYFFETLQKMSRNPVGCKLIRLILTRYLSDRDKIFSKAYIVSDNKAGRFRFGSASTSDQKMCVIPASYISGTETSTFAGTDPVQAQRVIERGESVTYINGFLPMFFFPDIIDSYDDVSLFGAMLRWFHYVSGEDIVSLEKSTDAILKLYTGAKNKESNAFQWKFKDLLEDTKKKQTALIEHFHDDYSLKCMFGFVYDKTSDTLKLDPLNESAYTTLGYQAVQVFTSPAAKEDTDFIGLFGDKELLDFYLQRKVKLPEFGKGQYKTTEKRQTKPRVEEIE